MDIAIGEENECFTDQTSWTPESEGQSTTISLTAPASLSPEPEEQSTTQRTINDCTRGFGVSYEALQTECFRLDYC